MNNALLLEKFPNILDSRGRINSNILKESSKVKTLIEVAVNEFIPESLQSRLPLKHKISIVLAHETFPRYSCETCGNLTKYFKKNNSFTTFCSFKCSRAKGSSTFKKSQETCLKKYGVKSNLALKQNFENIKNKYGGMGSASTIIKERIDKTVKEKYGVDNPFQLASVKEKIKDTHDKKYGGNFNTIKLGNKVALLNDRDYCEKMAKQFCLSTIADMIGCATNTVYKYFEKHGITNFNSSRSNAEVEIVEFINYLGISDVVVGNRKIIHPLELDIFIPEKNIAIEFNGLYWHSELNGTKPSYHVNKLHKCLDKNIRLLQIFENEWVLKTDIVKSKIASLLGRNSRLYARECEIKVLDNHTKKSFLLNNHLQGDSASSINFGLFYGDDLCTVMTFGKSRFDKNADYELIRYCSKKGFNVIGGFSKLLKHFKRNYAGVLISYADRRYSTGDVYEKNGFEFVSNSKPAYHYFKNSSIIMESRVKFQKHKLQNVLEHFDKNLSEWENMKNNGYNRIWDCGTSKWVMK